MRWTDLEPRYQTLLSRDVGSATELETLLLERGELDAEVFEAESRAYVRMTCHTDDEDAKRAYLHIVEEIQPEVKKVGFELDRKIVASPFARELDPRRYEVLLRELRADVEIYREENVALQAEGLALGQKYNELAGARSIDFRGETLTLEQAARHFENPARETRRAAWTLCSERRMRDKDAVDDVLDRMVAVRTEMARNAGFEDFVQYAFVQKHRFDYTIEDCRAFHAAIEEHCVPLRAAIADDHARALGIDAFLPWDQRVDPDGRAALRPFEDVEAMVAGVSRVFRRLDPELGELFDSLRDGGSLDLESRAGKAPGGYQISYEKARRPFIFMNAVGVDDDLRILVHEAGHAFHALLCRDDPLLHFREAGAEMSETASMSMELLAYPYLDEFYDEAGAARSRRKHLETVATLFCWVAQIDAFQHWIYAHPEHTRAQRDDEWVELTARYRPRDSWAGLDDHLRADWQRIPHLFTVPLYFVEYGIAQLGALGIWQQSLADEGRALANYKRALRLGGSKPLPELYAAAELEFSLSADTVRAAAETLRGALFQ